MQSLLPLARRTTLRSITVFLGLFALLYIAAAAVAEWQVARVPGTHPFQTLFAQSEREVDWLVIGSSHAMPLEFGSLPTRLRAETGQSMLILAETGAGPLYGLFLARQALTDVAPHRVLYVLDAFAFFSKDWNETRVADRDLLRHTPLRLSTTRELWRMVTRDGVPATALADYLTGFSKLNPPERFPQPGWQGQAAFERRFRPSRHSIDGRAAYLFPNGPDMAMALRYLDVLDRMVGELRAAGVEFEILRLPVPAPFKTALPDTEEFEKVLTQRLERLGVKQHDLQEHLPDPGFYFDPDHLNRAGVEKLYDTVLKEILAGRPSATDR